MDYIKFPMLFSYWTPAVVSDKTRQAGSAAAAYCRKQLYFAADRSFFRSAYNSFWISVNRGIISPIMS